jgi:hypothetical protein
MNTTIENTTDATSVTPKSFTDIRPKWKALAATRKITSADIVALCIYRAIIRGEGKVGAITRLAKSFTPVTNPIKLQNGAHTWHGLASGLLMSRKTPILGWLTEAEGMEILALAKSIDVSGKEIK